MRVIVLEPARVELQEAIDHYNQKKAGLGAEFEQEVDQAIERILMLPHAWTPLRNNIRRCRTNRFPYGIVYHPRDDEIIVLAIMHLHREPDYWENRLKQLPPAANEDA